MATTKMHLCCRASEKLKIPPLEIKAIFDCLMEEIITVMSEGDRIELRGFGAFEMKEKKGRPGRNPRTGEKLEIAPMELPYFKFSRDAKKTFQEKRKVLTAPPKK